MDRSDDERATYKVEEAARKLGIGRNQAYEAVKAGQIPAIRIGNSIRVLKKPFDAMLSGDVS